MKPILRSALGVVSLGLVAFSSGGADSGPLTLTYENPLWDGYLADPFVFKSGDSYYA